MTKHWIYPAAVLFLSMTALAGDTPAPRGIDSQAAFTRLRSLAGEWEATTPLGKVHLTFEVIANGSALVERLTVEKMPPMETIYHLDGARLLLTHYCMLGNQPRMQAESYDPETGELKFRFLDATNLASPDAGHMHNATLRLVDAEHLVEHWEFFENRKLAKTETFEFVRLR